MDIDLFRLISVFIEVQYVTSASGFDVCTVLWCRPSSYLCLFIQFRSGAGEVSLVVILYCRALFCGE